MSNPRTAATSATGCSRCSATASPLVPPAVLRLLPYPVAALLGSMGEKADPADMDGYSAPPDRLVG